MMPNQATHAQTMWSLGQGIQARFDPGAEMDLSPVRYLKSVGQTPTIFLSESIRHDLDRLCGTWLRYARLGTCCLKRSTLIGGNTTLCADASSTEWPHLGFSTARVVRFSEEWIRHDLDILSESWLRSGVSGKRHHIVSGR